MIGGGRGIGAADRAIQNIHGGGHARRSATNDFLERKKMGGVDEGASDLLSEERNSRSFRRVEPRKTGGRGGEPDS